MKLEFDSVEEVVGFITNLKPIPTGKCDGSWTPDEVAFTICKIRANVGTGDKLQAVKLHRYITGMFLKESKEMIERYW